MSTPNSIRSAAAIVTALILVAGFAWHDSSSTGEHELAPTENSSAHLNVTGLAQPQGENMRTPSLQKGGEPNTTETVLHTKVSPNPLAVQFGTVSGQVTGNDGQPVAGCMIQFVKNGKLSGSTTRTDENGYFLMELSTGEYTPQVMGKATEGAQTWVSWPPFLITARQITNIDLFAFDSFLLSGGFYRVDDEGELQDGATLQVEVLLAADASTCAATTWCTTSQQQVDKYMEQMAADPNPDDTPFKELKYPPGMGYFELPNLPPDLYEIRAYWDVGKKYYVRVIADLRSQNVDFGLHGISTKDFVTHKILFDSQGAR